METTLNLSGDYATEVLSWYLWGQPKKDAPTKSNIADEQWIDRQESITLNIDKTSFLQKVGNCVNAKDFKLFEVFFSGKARNGDNIVWTNLDTPVEFKNGEYYLTQAQFADLFFKDINGNHIKDNKKRDTHFIATNPNGKNAAEISLYNRNLYNTDFAKLAFVFGSLEIGLDTSKIRYVLDENLNPLRVENVEYIINEQNDNFDFTGGDGSNFVNPILKQIADPSGIGKTVKLNFDGGARLDGGTITANDYKNTKSLVEFNQTSMLDTAIDSDGRLAYILFLKEFKRIRQTGIIDYLDENNKLVIFGSNDDDPISGTQAKNFDFLDDVSIDKLPDWLVAEVVDLNHFKDYVKNGIHYIGANGNDSITGTQYDDILEGGDDDDTLDGGDGSDKLYGGSGNDTYKAGDKDIIQDDDDGAGSVEFDGNLLVGGTWDETEQCYIDDNNKNIKYTLNGNDSQGTLTVKFGDKTLTINNYSKEKQSLNINLAEQKGKEIAIVIDTTGSMQDDIDTAKQTARVIAENIFRTNSDQTQYSKISIVTFSDNSIKTIGTYTTISAFQSGINSVFIENGSQEYAMAALLEGMSNFTPDNGLSKEIYLMTDEPGDDNHRKSEVLARARDLKMGMAKMARNSDFNENYDNSVKINIISINSNLDHFKELSDQTGGSFFQPNSLSELEDTLFELSNLGTSKSETIIGNDKNNTLNGKGGDDILQGGLGSDTYEFDDNFGKDTIIETNPNNNDKNIIKFNNLTTIKDLTFTQNANDLIINHKNKQNSITIKDFYTNETKISFLEFADGSKLSNTDLKDFALMQNNKSMLHYAQANEPNLNENLKSTFFMADKNTPSNISGAMLNDSLIGSDKNDSIWGGYGNDILIGKKGNDTLNGGKGDDKYIYTKFDGSDIIQDNGGSDTLVLRGISKDEANFTQSGKDLIISFNFNNDKITIKDHFKWLFGKPNKIENIIFDKDENLTISQIDEFITNKWNKITYNDISNKFNSNISESVGEFISQEKIDKIIEQINTYSDDKGLGNFAFNDIQNSQNLQLYGV